MNKSKTKYLRMRARTEGARDGEIKMQGEARTCSQKRRCLRRKKSEAHESREEKVGEVNRRWEDCVSGDTEVVGLTEDKAEDRKGWRRWEKPLL